MQGIQRKDITMVNVLIVDDSALIREYMKEVLSGDKDINVVDSVSDPYMAVKVLSKEKIDVITLDLEMPKMDGLTFLEKLMRQRPLPVVVCSSIAEQGSQNAIKALELGAIEVITKAKLGVKDFLENEKYNLRTAVKNASKVNLNKLKEISQDDSIKPVLSKPKHLLSQTTNKVIAIGASTGGTIVLRRILSRLPKTNTGIIVSQHMPEGFTKQFSNSLDTISMMDISEATDGEKITMGSAIIARGNHHLKIERSGAYYQCQLSKDDPVNRHRPSVDVMFHSVAENVGSNALGVLLTGMGKDGAVGLKAIQEAGGTTIAQNEKSCVVYGMPKAAIEIGAADHILGIDEIIEQIIQFQ